MQRNRLRRPFLGRSDHTNALVEAVEPRLLFAYPRMTQVAGGSNPLNGIDLGNLSVLTMGDVDSDGDLDAIAGEGNSGALLYFKNTGSATNPVYTQQIAGANPFNGVDLGTHSSPALGDVNGDGRLDLVAGAEDGILHYFRNTGSSTSPAFVEQTGAANPWNGVDVGFDSAPTLGDVDGDGDLDTLMGNFDGVLRYYRNTGNVLTPTYVEQIGAANPWDGVDVDFHSRPTLVDVDTDGDLDAVVGETGGTLRYFRNNGTATSPTYGEQTGSGNPFNGFDTADSSAPAWGDVDGDGDIDAFAGSLDGTLRYYRNDAIPPAAKFTPISGAANPFNGLDVGNNSAPWMTDIDRDGDRDAVVGASDGTLRYYKNTGTAASPVYVQQTGTANPFNGIDVGDFAVPTMGGLISGFGTELIVGAGDGTLRYYKNTGTSANPLYTEQPNPFSAFDVGTFASPALVEVNGDILTDVIVGAGDGTIHYFKNMGPGVAPVFVEQPVAANPWGTIDVGDRAALAFADVDGDADVDLTVGAQDGTLRYFRNTSGGYTLQSGPANPVEGFSVGTNSTPSLGDVDGDGDLDVVAGALDGTLHVFRNDGAATRTINYVQVSGPLDGVWESLAKPALADLDGDGDLDAVVGSTGGTVRYFKNLGTSTSPAYEEQGGPYNSQTNTGNPFNGFDIGTQATPAFGDLDADGDFDIIIGEGDGGLQYWRNNGGPRTPAFQVFGVNADVGDLSTPTLGDLDGDGDLDFVVGAGDGTIHYFKNVGTATSSSHVEQGGPYNPQTNTGNPFAGVDVGGQSAPHLGDVDGDGDLDLVIGGLGIPLQYLKNTGSATVPAFAGIANPFNGITPDTPAAPALGDFDHDGDLDATVGQGFGGQMYLRANRGPVVNNSIADQTFAGAGVLSFVVPADTFADLDKDAMTYTANRVGGAALPAWLTFNPATRTFSGNPSPNDTSSIQIRVTANDGNGGTGFDDFQLILGNVADNATHVTTLADENNGNADPLAGTGTSLREAINYANSLGTNPEITFDPSLTSGGPATITLGGTELAITNTLEISGPGANLLTIAANNASRVINVSGGGSGTTLISGITITGGNASFGAGINNNGANLSLNGVVLTGNTASSFGGGLASLVGGVVTIRDSTVSNNTAGNEAAAIESQGVAGSPSAVTLINCTVSGNITNGSGLGAISNVASGATATLTLQNCTIANNTGAIAGGVLNAVNSGSAATTYVATLFSNGGPNLVNFGGTVTSLGHNLSSDNTGNLTATGDLPNTNPSLNPLASNGGPTPTMALRPNSPAINAGVAIAGISNDQRGVSRPQGPTPDIGAYERQATAATLTSMSYEYETKQAVTFIFNADASVTFGRSSYTIQNLTTGQTLPSTIGTLNFNVLGTQATLVLTNLLPNGDYRVTSGAATPLDFFVLKGDANHDRKVNFDDYVKIDLGFNNYWTGYSNGDFNYDGVVNFDDYVIIDTAFNTAPALGRNGGISAVGKRGAN